MRGGGGGQRRLRSRVSGRKTGAHLRSDGRREKRFVRFGRSWVDRLRFTSHGDRMERACEYRIVCVPSLSPGPSITFIILTRGGRRLPVFDSVVIRFFFSFTRPLERLTESRRRRTARKQTRTDFRTSNGNVRCFGGRSFGERIGNGARFPGNCSCEISRVSNVQVS